MGHKRNAGVGMARPSTCSWIGLISILAVTLGLLNGYAAPQWHEESGFRWADLQVPAAGKTGFTLLSPKETGINFTNSLDEHTGEANRVLFNGSGVAVGDFD